MNDRGRITVGDVVLWLFAFGVLYALIPVALVEIETVSLASEERVLFDTIAPLAVLVLIVTIYGKARLGAK